MSEFKTVYDFAKWYFANGMPNNSAQANCAGAIETDDAASCVLYRDGRFQVELYIMLPNRNLLTSHCHPKVHTLLFEHDKKGKWVNTSSVYDTQYHGTNTGRVRKDAIQLLAIERWDEGINMTSAAVHWCGKTAGKLHDEVIRSYYPDAITKEGFADVRLDPRIYEEVKP